MRLDGYGLFVNDMATMIRFYRDVLGFEIKENENTDNVYLIKDGTLFLLYGRKDFEKMTSKRFEYLQGINAHSEMALYVDTFQEVDEQYQNAISKGATSLLEPTTEPWGQRTCFMADPEGNVIEIVEQDRWKEEAWSTTKKYDNKNRVVRETFGNPGRNGEGNYTTVTYSYDKDGNCTEKAFVSDKNGNPIKS